MENFSVRQELDTCGKYAIKKCVIECNELVFCGMIDRDQNHKQILLMNASNHLKIYICGTTRFFVTDRQRQYFFKVCYRQCWIILYFHNFNKIIYIFSHCLQNNNNNDWQPLNRLDKQFLKTKINILNIDHYNTFFLTLIFFSNYKIV